MSARTQIALGVFTAAIALLSLAFWGAALLMGGVREVIAGIDMTAMVLFSMAHLPAMASAILLWRAGAAKGRPALRWGLFVAMIYFSAACIIAVLGNALAASILGMIQP